MAKNQQKTTDKAVTKNSVCNHNSAKSCAACLNQNKTFLKLRAHTCEQ